AHRADRRRIQVRAPGHRRRTHPIRPRQQPRHRDQRNNRPQRQESTAMIPDHLIGKAAAAIYAATAFGDEFAIDAWHDMNDDNPIKTTTRMYARAALETVAADIWDDAYNAGFKDSKTDRKST